MTHVHVAIPIPETRAGVRSMTGCLESAAHVGISLKYHPGCSLPHQRDNACHHFLHHTEATHLLMVDGDMSWGWADLELLLALDKPIAFGLYLKKGGGGWAAHGPVTHTGPNVQRWELAGTGFFLMRRDAVVRACEGRPMYRRDDGVRVVSLFECRGYTQAGGELVAELEDYAFCRRWVAAGGELWTDTRCRPGHWGEREYR